MKVQELSPTGMRTAADKAALAALGLAGLGLVLATTVAALDLGFGTVLFQHGRKLAFALLALLLLTRVGSGVLVRTAMPVYLITLALVIAALCFPPEYGARRWIRLGGSFRFQPTEFAKIGLIVYTALLAARASSTRELYRALLPTLGLVFFLFLQPDIGSALLCAGVGGAILVVAGMPRRHLLVLLVGGVLVVLIAWLAMPHVRERVTGFIDPEPGSQVSMSLTALGNGGLAGTGLGQGVIKQGHLVKCGNDFIFAIVGEEMGLLGTLGVLVLLAIFGWHGFRIAGSAGDRFMGLLAFGVVFCVVAQALAHVAVNTASAPAKGIDFPFLGSGGSSLVFALGSVGLLRSVAHCSGGAEGRILWRPRRWFGGNVANVERYGVLSLCFLIALILGISLFGPDPDPVRAADRTGSEAVLPPVDQELFDECIADDQEEAGSSSITRVEEDRRRTRTNTPARSQPARPQQERNRTYRVRRGDNLHLIAKRQCGSTRLVDRILKLNPKIGDGSHLDIGQVLVLPPRRR